jgi:hypothetical protein
MRMTPAPSGVSTAFAKNDAPRWCVGSFPYTPIVLRVAAMSMPGALSCRVNPGVTAGSAADEFAPTTRVAALD